MSQLLLLETAFGHGLEGSTDCKSALQAEIRAHIISWSEGLLPDEKYEKYFTVKSTPAALSPDDTKLLLN